MFQLRRVSYQQHQLQLNEQPQPVRTYDQQPLSAAIDSLIPAKRIDYFIEPSRIRPQKATLITNDPPIESPYERPLSTSEKNWRSWAGRKMISY